MDKAHLTHLQKGGELLRAEKVVEAAAELELAHGLKPGDPKIMNLLGLTYFRLERYEEAQRLYGSLREKQPKDAGIRLNLGLVYLKTNEVDGAVAELEAARDLDPYQTRTLGYLGLAYARAGRYAEAREAFLGAGQNELAKEMEQHLASEQPIEEAPAAFAEAEAEAAPAMPEPSPPMFPVDTRPSNGVAKKIVLRPEDGPALTLTDYVAKRLVRPEEGDRAIELGAGGALVLRIRGRLLSRTLGVIASGGDLTYEPQVKRMRGKAMEDMFGQGPDQVFAISGAGHLVALPRGGVFSALLLEDDIFYVREETLFAFEESLGWENGQVPGSRGEMPVVQLRGDGALALRTSGGPLGVEVIAGRVLFVDAASLIGWSGRVVPKVVFPEADAEPTPPFVECTGEGVVLLETAGEPTS
jgi:uncharacterized protein (AIM24 family)